MSAAGQTSGMSDIEYLEYMRRKIAADRVPYTGSIELTHRCNLRCIHCYLGDQSSIPQARAAELTTDAWRSVLDQIAAAGCLELLITGGEPLLREDFVPIFRHAKESGFVVTVFTNAALITDRIADVFADLPPFLVESTLYGATAATHDRVTQRKGSFDACLAGMERLHDRHVSVGLKTIVMELNKDEFHDMEALASSLGARWRLDAAICPCLPNADSEGFPNRCTTAETSRLYALGQDSRSPLRLRVEPREVVALELASEKRVKALYDAYTGMQSRPVSDRMYTCGAGLTGFHIDPYGLVQPCMMTTGYRHSALGEGGFAAAWEAVGRIRERKAPAGYICNTCDKQPICSGCPALFDLENGAESSKSEYMCALTEERYRCIQHKRPASGANP